MATRAYLSWNYSLFLLCISFWETLYEYNHQQPLWDFSYFNKHLIEKLFSRFLQSSLHPWSPTIFLKNWQLISNFSYFKTIFDDFFSVLTVHLNVTRTYFEVFTIKQFSLLSSFLYFAPDLSLYDFRRIFRVLSFSNK